MFQNTLPILEKIAHCASTQKNESINHVIASKCLESKHYSGYSSIFSRVAAGVAQNNLGLMYGARVYQKMGLQQNKSSINKLKQEDKLRRTHAYRIATLKNKKRRFTLKKLRGSKNAASEKREGMSYQSGFDDVSNLLNCPSEAVKGDTASNLEHCKVVIYDLKTTALYDDDIVQISAESHSEESAFNVYIIPSKPFSNEASRIIGLRIFNGELHLYGNRIEATSPQIACLKFLQFLQGLQARIILAAHNGSKFDDRRIIALMGKCKLINEFSSIVKGYVDTLTIFHKLLPERRKDPNKNFKLESLSRDFLDENPAKFSLHNAKDDVK